MFPFILLNLFLFKQYSTYNLYTQIWELFVHLVHSLD